MIDIIVKISGSIFCLGIGVVLLAVGLLILSAFVTEVYGRCLNKMGVRDAD